MYELIPMLALTGNPTREKICDTLKAFKKNGVTAVLLYPRSGCEVGYMSERWFEVCGAAIEFAHENGMKIWLYDDFNWPSGSCHGRVTEEHPEFIAKAVAVENGKAAVKSALKDGMKPDAPTLTDVLNPDAVKCFIKSTHEVYYRLFGQYFGKTIEAIFTDEPSFVYNTRGIDNDYPYYDGIAEDYRARYRSDFFEDIIKYHNLKTKGETFAEFATRYYSLLGERFAHSFTGQIVDWCEKHGIDCAGHMFNDSNVSGSVVSNGDIFKVLMRMQIPGIDATATDFDGHETALYSILSALNEFGKKHLMAELFAYGPCSMTYAEKKRQIMRCAMFGVGRFVLALAHLDARGNTVKSGYFNNYSPYAPDAKFMKVLAADAENAAHFASLEPIADICVRYPRGEALNNIASEDNLQKVNSLYERTLFALDEAQISYRVLIDGEKDDSMPTVSLKSGRITVENKELSFDDTEEFAAWIKENVNTDACVCERDGRRAEGLLFRRYANGEFMVIDRTEKTHKARKLTLVTNGAKRDFTLGCFGVYTGKEDLPEMLSEECIDVSNAELLYNTPSLKRLYTENGKAEFFFPCDTDITINKCAYPNEYPLFLDGEERVFGSASTSLTECFNNLYKKSETLHITKGTHTVTTETPDLPFFPAVILEGSFDPKTLGERSGKLSADGEYFYGNMSVKFDVDIPDADGDIYIEYDETEMSMLPCELFIDGKCVGMRAYSPYSFELPPDCRGKHSAELRFYSTYAPMFDRPYDRFRVIEDESTMKWFMKFNAVPEVLLLRGLRLTARKRKR